MGISKRCQIALTIVILNAILLPLSSGARLPESEPNKAKSIFKRQTHGYGFHTNVPNPMLQNSANSNYNRYEHPRSNNLNYNSNPRDYQYYPSSSSYGGRDNSIIMGGGGRSGNYYDSRDNRQPYYNNNNNDDYRYNGYQRDVIAQPNNEVVVRHGQMRHEEYQKRTGSGGPEYYDPFYFLGARSSQEPQSSLSPSVSTLPVVRSTTAITASVAPPRNRRNSHQRLNDFNNDINGAKYDIMTKSAYPLPASSSHHHHHHHRLSNHHINNNLATPNQFLTREQLVRQHPVSFLKAFFVY